MVLRREDDLTKAPKGRPNAPPAPAATAASRARDSRRLRRPWRHRGACRGAPGVAGREGLRLPPGPRAARCRAGDEGQRGRRPARRAREPARSVGSGRRRLARRLRATRSLGIPTGTGQGIGGLYFDPQGADFTLWVTAFKDEVYRNWIVPQSALLGGARGHVDFEFTVERNGSMSALRMLKSSGTHALDRAAQYALIEQPLPAAARRLRPAAA